MTIKIHAYNWANGRAAEQTSFVSGSGRALVGPFVVGTRHNFPYALVVCQTRFRSVLFSAHAHAAFDERLAEKGVCSE